MRFSPQSDSTNDPRHTVRGECPVCSGSMHVTRLECNSCGSALEGHFLLNRLSRLTHEQMAFLESFIGNRGVIKDIEVDLGISYPTVKSRLEDVTRALGYGGSETSLRPSQIREERRSILEDLQKERISADDAARRLSVLGERKGL